MTHLHRKHSTHPEITAAEEAELRALLLQVAGALSSRPEPRDFWDDLGRRDTIARHPKWANKLVETLRSALEAGKGEDAGTQAATVHRVRVFFDSLAALTLRGYETTAAEELGGVLVETIKESADVSVAAARAIHEPTDRNLELLRHEVTQEIEEGERVLDLTARTLAARRTPTRQLAVR